MTDHNRPFSDDERDGLYRAIYERAYKLLVPEGDWDEEDAAQSITDDFMNDLDGAMVLRRTPFEDGLFELAPQVLQLGLGFL